MIKISLNALTGFTQQEFIKITAAAAEAELALNSVAFRESMLGFKQAGYQYSTGWGPFKKWHYSGPKNFFAWNYLERLDGSRVAGMTNQQVYDAVMAGRSLYEGAANGVIEIEVTKGNQAGVLGWTYPNRLMTWISGWFISDASTSELAMNLTHEAMHKIGFNHSYERSSIWPSTIPYWVGYKVRDIVADKLKTKKIYPLV